MHKTNGILDTFRKSANTYVIFKMDKIDDVKKLIIKYSIKSMY